MWQRWDLSLHSEHHASQNRTKWQTMELQVTASTYTTLDPNIESFIKWCIVAEAESHQEEQSLCPLTPGSRVSGILPSSFPTVQEKPSSLHIWVSQSNQCWAQHHNIVGKTSAQSPDTNRPKERLLSPWLFAKKGELRVRSSCLYKSQLHNSYSQWQSARVSKVKTITKHPLLEIIAIA